MSGDLLLLFAIVFLALGFSFLCSVAEAVLLSITPSYIASLRERIRRAPTFCPGCAWNGWINRCPRF